MEEVMDLDKQIEEYKIELEKTKVLFYKLSGAIESLEALKDSDKKKDKK
jgi:hypothetical protein|tara:strand:+ start:72 stop:218 length:147 start_codon:yes stop_codon:yes gene_type:complete